MTETASARPSFWVKFWAAFITIVVLMLLSTSLRGGDALPTAFALGTVDEFVGDLPTEHIITTGHYDVTAREGFEPGTAPVGTVDETHLWLVALPGEQPIVLSQFSPWRGCRVVVADAEQAAGFNHTVADDFVGFVDPCHGGLWDIRGNHIAGPGTRGLGSFPTRLDSNGMILLDLTSLRYID